MQTLEVAKASAAPDSLIHQYTQYTRLMHQLPAVESTGAVSQADPDLLFLTSPFLNLSVVLSSLATEVPHYPACTSQN